MITLTLLGATACATSMQGADPVAGRLPDVPELDGPLSLALVYPPEDAALAVRSSTFVFGSTGSGRARLTINGAAVDVAPNGAFLAFLPVPEDGIYRLEATLDGSTERLERVVELPDPPAPADGPAIIEGTLQPSGPQAIARGESVEVRFRGRSGGAAWLVLPSGARLPMFETMLAPERAAGADFDRAPATDSATSPALSDYRRLVSVRIPWLADGQADVPVVGTLAGALPAPQVELVIGTDTTRALVRANVAVLEPGTPRVAIATPPPDALPDWTIRGRNDVSGPFHDFWPAGTSLLVTGQRDRMLRVRLTRDRVSWVPVTDTQVLPAGVPPPTSTIDGARLAPATHWIDVRIPLDSRLPFRVEEDGRTIHIDVFGAVSRANFFQYGTLDPLVEYAEWSQPSQDAFRVSVRLSSDVWGYHTFHDGDGALVLRIRRPPEIDPGDPFAGLYIAVDAGHPPAGATGPTGWTEAEANLAIARRLEQMLRREGVRVLMTRTDDGAVDLGSRPRMATDSNTHLLISVHNNAFPDGVDPWQNSGTSVYYYQPHSASLARSLQSALLEELGLRDLGIGRADLALARTTWMPAVLSETMFLMVPRHEAALRNPAVIDRIARAHVAAIRAWLLAYVGIQPAHDQLDSDVR